MREMRGDKDLIRRRRVVSPPHWAPKRYNLQSGQGSHPNTIVSIYLLILGIADIQLPCVHTTFKNTWIEHKSPAAPEQQPLIHRRGRRHPRIKVTHLL